MNNSIFNLQKIFFSKINTINELKSSGINMYSSVPKGAIMPYIAITSINTAPEDTISQKNYLATLELSIFDNSSGITNLANIVNILNNTIDEKFLNEGSENMNFISISTQQTNFQNDITNSVVSAKILYNLIFSTQ